MTYVCPKDSSHQSEDADYCSICGTKISAAPLVAPSLPLPSAAGSPGVSSAVSGEVCPDCGLARNAGARFCEVCRYDFEAHTSGLPSPSNAPLVQAPTAAAPAVTAPAALDPVLAPDMPDTVPAPVPSPESFRVWQAIAAVDPSLYVEPDPAKPCPVGEPERTFPLDLAESLIGRRSDRLDIHPEVPLTDTGVSHRHAKILRQPDGSLILLDLGSTNGTQVNGQDAPAGVPTPLNAGDQITLGCWTRITLKSS